MLAREEKIGKSYPLEDEQVDRRKVVKKKKSRMNAKVAIVGVALTSFVLAVSVLYGYATITKMKLEISNLESDRVALETEKEYMIANLEEVKSTSKIEDKAIIKLGMDYPKTDQVVYIDVNKTDIKAVKQEKGLIKSLVNSVLGLF